MRSYSNNYCIKGFRECINTRAMDISTLSMIFALSQDVDLVLLHLTIRLENSMFAYILDYLAMG